MADPVNSEIKHGIHRPKRLFDITGPAERYVRCTCGRTDCWTNGLLPLRAHMAALFRAIIALGYAECFDDYDRGHDPWPGVIYNLQMAASVVQLEADPTAASDSEAGFWCGDAWDREEEEREAASKYAAALICFNFAWAAYEAAIELSAQGHFEKDKLPVRGRKLLDMEGAQVEAIRSFRINYHLARHHCRCDPNLRAELDTSEAQYQLSAAGRATELVRIFRNHVVHGRDSIPTYGEDSCWRFYAVARTLLLLTQHLVLRRLKDGSAMVPLSVNQDELGQARADVYLRNLHYRDALWREPADLPKRHDGQRLERRFRG